MTRLSDALALAGLATLAAVLPVVAVAGPHAGLVTAAVGLAICGVAAAVGVVGEWVRP